MRNNLPPINKGGTHLDPEFYFLTGSEYRQPAMQMLEMPASNHLFATKIEISQRESGVIVSPDRSVDREVAFPAC